MAMEENVVIDEGTGKNGVRKRLHFEGDFLTIQRTWDREPHIDRAQAIATATRGERWGEDRYVGSIPPAMYADLLKRGVASDPKALKAFFVAHPDLCAFDKYIK